MFDFEIVAGSGAARDADVTVEPLVVETWVESGSDGLLIEDNRITGSMIVLDVEAEGVVPAGGWVFETLTMQLRGTGAATGSGLVRVLLCEAHINEMERPPVVRTTTASLTSEVLGTETLERSYQEEGSFSLAVVENDGSGRGVVEYTRTYTAQSDTDLLTCYMDSHYSDFRFDMTPLSSSSRSFRRYLDSGAYLCPTDQYWFEWDGTSADVEDEDDLYTVSTRVYVNGTEVQGFIFEPDSAMLAKRGWKWYADRYGCRVWSYEKARHGGAAAVLDALGPVALLSENLPGVGGEGRRSPEYLAVAVGPLKRGDVVTVVTRGDMQLINDGGTWKPKGTCYPVFLDAEIAWSDKPYHENTAPEQEKTEAGTQLPPDTNTNRQETTNALEAVERLEAVSTDESVDAAPTESVGGMTAPARPVFGF